MTQHVKTQNSFEPSTHKHTEECRYNHWIYKGKQMGIRTVDFAISFRRSGWEWYKNLPVLAKWAKCTGFDAIDLQRTTKEDVDALKEAGLTLGSVDLLNAEFKGVPVCMH